jgi:hypothetical protein
VSHRGRESADERLAVELASGKTVRDAATAAGVSEMTAHRRRADPASKSKVVAARSLMVEFAAGRLACSMGRAADVLDKLLNDPDPRVQLRAADRLLTLAIQVRVTHDLAAELNEVKAILASPVAPTPPPSAGPSGGG